LAVVSFEINVIGFAWQFFKAPFLFVSRVIAQLVGNQRPFRFIFNICLRVCRVLLQKYRKLMRGLLGLLVMLFRDQRKLQSRRILKLFWSDFDY